jgi:hypothetical protein
MRKCAFLAGAILAAFALVALVTADRATAFNDNMDTLASYPPTTAQSGGWTVTLVGVTPLTGAGETGRFAWHYQVYKNKTSSATGLVFVALMVPNCNNCGCGDFSPACPQAITSWVAPIGKVCLAGTYCDSNAQGFLRVFNVGVGEHRFNFGRDIMEGYVVKGWTSWDNDDYDW